MKKARHVSIDRDAVLSADRCEKLITHGVNSGTYYVERFNYTPGAVREKLRSKGYPDDSVMVAPVSPHDDTHEVNLIDAVMKNMSENGLFDDTEANAFALAKSQCESGHSAHSVKNKLYAKKYNKSIIDDVVAAYDDRTALDNAIALLWRSFKRSESPQQRQEKIVQRLVGRGFRYNDIETALAEFMDEQDSYEEVERFSNAYLNDLWL